MALGNVRNMLDWLQHNQKDYEIEVLANGPAVRGYLPGLSLIHILIFPPLVKSMVFLAALMQLYRQLDQLFAIQTAVDLLRNDADRNVVGLSQFREFSLEVFIVRGQQQDVDPVSYTHLFQPAARFIHRTPKFF